MAATADDGIHPVVIVTGAAKRLGRHIAVALADSMQFDVAVHFGHSERDAASVHDEIVELGRRCVTVSADLADPLTAAEKIFSAAASLGTVTALINCAAVFEDQCLANVDLSHCERHFFVNTFAPLFLSQQFSRQLPEDRAGHIINILDWRATRTPATHVVYAASKAALASITKSLAQQLAPQIQVNAIAPGAVLPPEDKPNWHKERALASIPLQRPGSPSDVVAAVEFLLKSPFINGEILHVDGGEGLLHSAAR